MSAGGWFFFRRDGGDQWLIARGEPRIAPLGERMHRPSESYVKLLLGTDHRGFLHSYGGHSTIFAAALEPRIRCAVANGPVSAFREHGDHRGRPLGHGGGEYLRPFRPWILDPDRPLPVTLAEITALIAPRPLLVGQAVGERRPREEENHAAVAEVYEALGEPERLRWVWYAGDHDVPPELREEAVEWLAPWLREGALEER